MTSVIILKYKDELEKKLLCNVRLLNVRNSEIIKSREYFGIAECRRDGKWKRSLNEGKNVSFKGFRGFKGILGVLREIFWEKLFIFPCSILLLFLFLPWRETIFSNFVFFLS